MPMDTISIRNYHMTAAIGPDAWNRSGKMQPIVLTLKLLIDTTSAGQSDEIGYTFSYGQMCKDVAFLSGRHFCGLDDLVEQLPMIASAANWPGRSLQISLVAPKALLRAEGGLGREVTFWKQASESETAKNPPWAWERRVWLIKQLKVACIIGVNPHERLEKQQVTIDLEILGQDEIEKTFNAEQNGEDKSLWILLVSKLCCAVESSRFQTLEALAAMIAKTCLREFPILQITVLVEKPSALTFVDGAGVEITRDRTFLAQ